MISSGRPSKSIFNQPFSSVGRAHQNLGDTWPGVLTLQRPALTTECYFGSWRWLTPAWNRILVGWLAAGRRHWPASGSRTGGTLWCRNVRAELWRRCTCVMKNTQTRRRSSRSPWDEGCWNKGVRHVLSSRLRDHSLQLLLGSRSAQGHFNPCRAQQMTSAQNLDTHEPNCWASTLPTKGKTQKLERWSRTLKVSLRQQRPAADP